jgi:hypothetical protein
MIESEQEPVKTKRSEVITSDLLRMMFFSMSYWQVNGGTVTVIT